MEGMVSGMPTKIDMTGRKYGRLTAISEVPSKRPIHWLCRCDCGTVKEVIGASLRNGTTASCGCLAVEIAARRTTKHGMARTRIYTTWAGMIQRCTNKKAAGYHSYGGRGIKVSPRWMKFENFFADMGDKPDGLTLERIDNDGDYEPSNCRWATMAEQSANKRGTVWFDHRGHLRTALDIAAAGNIHRQTLISRVEKLGWSVEKAVEAPVRGVWVEYNGERKPLAQWAKDLGVPYARLYQRIKKLGYSPEKALGMPGPRRSE